MPLYIGWSGKLSEKAFKQRPVGSEEVSHVDIWGDSGIVNVKALRQVYVE